MVVREVALDVILVVGGAALLTWMAMSFDTYSGWGTAPPEYYYPTKTKVLAVLGAAMLTIGTCRRHWRNK